MSHENLDLTTALQEIHILIVPKNIAIYNSDNHIVELYLSRFGIKTIPSDFFQKPIFQKLEKLYLNSNKLNELNDKVFSPLKNLHFLNLSRNYLKKVERNTFSQLTSIEQLDLSNNLISEIEEYSFSDLKKIVNLNLKNNQLETLPDKLFVNPSLTYLDLSINKLRKIPLAIIQLYSSNIAHLDLKRNYIPSEFAKTFTTSPVIHSFISEMKEFWNKNIEDIQITNLDLIIKQYLFNALMSVYHYSVNVPVINYSLLNITLGYMTKNFYLLSSFIGESKELSFRQNLVLWYKCLDAFKPIEEALMKLLSTTEDSNERQRRILERKEKSINEIENEVVELGGIFDFKFKKVEISEIEPVHENLFALIKQFMDWNTQDYSTVFL